MTTSRLLVVENAADDDVRRLGGWLTEAGLELVTVRPHLGEPLPADLAPYAGLLVLGGSQQAFDGPNGKPAAGWFPALRELLRVAVEQRVPTLGVCLGGQLLASAMGGRVRQGTPEVGAYLVAKRDAAERDPLFAGLPFTPDVYQWHLDEIVALPPGAVLLAASTDVPHQAFRVGDKAWGLQFHIEPDVAMLTDWAEYDRELLTDAGVDIEALLARCAAVADDVESAWKPFAERFAAMVRGIQGSLPLPVIQG